MGKRAQEGDLGHAWQACRLAKARKGRKTKPLQILIRPDGWQDKFTEEFGGRAHCCSWADYEKELEETHEEVEQHDAEDDLCWS